MTVERKQDRGPRHWPKRLGWRVPVVVALWLIPHLFGIAGYPMTEEVAAPYRDACVGGLVIAFGSWLSRQGRRQPKNNGGNGASP